MKYRRFESPQQLEGNIYVGSYPRETKLWCALLFLWRSYSHVVNRGLQGGEPHLKCLNQVCVNCDHI